MGSKGQKVYGWVFHVIVWAAVLALPFFSFLPGRRLVGGNGYLYFLVMVCSFMLVFYVNWFWLIRKYLFAKRPGRFALANLVLGLATMGLCHLVFRILLPAPAPQPDPPSYSWLLPVRFFVGNLAIYALVAAVSVAVRMTGEWYRAENLRTEAELQHLKSQLNPHFLFNTLNNIYSLIQIDQERLPEDRFFRVGKSHIVNLPKVKVLERGRIVFGDKYVPVSDGVREEFYRRLSRFTLLPGMDKT